MRKKMVKVKNNSAKKSSTKKAPANKWWFQEFGDNLMKNAEEISANIRANAERIGENIKTI